jgi:hypothetical protein
VQPQTAGHDITGDIGQPQAVSVSIGPQPGERVGDADPQLLGQHAGRLIDFRPVPGKLGGLAAGPAEPAGPDSRFMISPTASGNVNAAGAPS